MSHPLIQPRGQWMRDVITDEEVVARIQGGESVLFELLVRRHNQRLFRVVRSRVLDDDEAEEALQQAHVNAWRALGQFEGRSSFLTWITRIAIRSADALVAKRRRRSDVESLAAISECESTDGNATQESRVELRRLIERAIDALPPKYRSVFVLREVEGLSTQETATDLELTESAVKIRLMRAREKMRDHLMSQAGDLDCVRTAWQFDGARCDRITAAVLEEIRGLST